MRIRYLFGALSAAGVMAVPLRAQTKDTTVKQKAAKVAHNVAATTKKAGTDTKAEVKRDVPKVESAAKTAGSDVKTGAKKAVTATDTAVKKVGRKIKGTPKDTTKKP